MKAAPRRSSALGFALLLAVTLVLPSGSRAGAVRTWSASTAAELQAGTLDGVALDEEGALRLAPALETWWGPSAGVVWKVAPAGPRAAWVALSGPARVLKTGAGDEAEVWYEGGENELVTALAPDGENGVWIGLSPSGQVLRVRPGDGDTLRVERYETETTFIWDLEPVGDGAVWVATGLPGQLLRLEPDGMLRSEYDAGDDMVRCVTRAPSGGLVLGTGGKGRVVRIDRDGRPFVLLDADEPEVVATAVREDGTVFALVARSSKQPGGASPTPPRGDASASVTVTATPPPEANGPGDDDGGASPSPPSAPVPTRFASVPGGAVYRIDPDGATRLLWQADSEMPFDMILAGDGRLRVATGDAGGVLTLDDEGRATRLLRIPSNQASSLARFDDDRIVVGGTTDARVVLLGAGPREQGQYRTPAIDAGSVADWGRVSWAVDGGSGGSIRVEARVGNTDAPDDHWSDWATIRSERDGAAGRFEGLPAARWIQVRLTLRAARDRSPVVRRLDVVYQPRNRAPRIESLSVEPAGVAWFENPNPSSSFRGPLVADDPVARQVAASVQRRVPNGGGAVRRAYEPGARTIQWQANDPDDDRLRFDVDLRREGEATWFPLARDLDAGFLSWDARDLPDGVYRIRLRVSDRSDNPAGEARTAERVSDAFHVDHHAPSVGEPRREGSPGTGGIEFEATDAGGAVAAVEISIDGGPWQSLLPLDGVADGERERFRAPWPLEAATMRVRVVDAAGNVGGALWPLVRGSVR